MKMTNNANELFIIDDFPNICRLCLMKKDDLKLMEPLDLIGLLDVLKHTTDFKIESKDGLPKKVCIECTNKLEYVSSFIDLCKQSETKLKDILKKCKIEVDTEDREVKFKIEVEDLDEPFCPCEYDFENKINKKSDAIEHTLITSKKVKLEKPIDSETDTILHHKFAKEETIKPSTKRTPSDCEICGEHFSTRTKLYEHKRKNISCRIRQYECTECDKAFFTNFKLKLHIRSHTKETPYECKICLKKFRFVSNVNRHVNVVHKSLKPFKCDICGKGFTRKDNLIEHRRDHSGEFPFICSYCGLSFNKRGPYHYHLNLHNARNSENNTDLICNICAKVFGSQSSLRKHKDTHTKENSFLCDVCGKNFRTNQTLSNHFKVHLGVKPFKCRICDKTFSRKSTLKVHFLSHTKEKPFKCSMCLKTFAQVVHLKSHERVHSGEKPYQCTFCSRNFSVKCNLVIHTRIHTKDTKYKCTVCDKIYYESRSLKKHMKIHQDSSLIVLTNEDISTLLS